VESRYGTKLNSRLGYNIKGHECHSKKLALYSVIGGTFLKKTQPRSNVEDQMNHAEDRGRRPNTL